MSVSYRPSYSTSAPPPDTADRLRLADIVMNDIPQHGVTANVRVEGATVELEVPGPEVLGYLRAQDDLSASANQLTSDFYTQAVLAHLQTHSVAQEN